MAGALGGQILSQDAFDSRPQEPALANKQKRVSADRKVAAPCIDREPGNKTATGNSQLRNHSQSCPVCLLRQVGTTVFIKPFSGLRS